MGRGGASYNHRAAVSSFLPFPCGSTQLANRRGESPDPTRARPGRNRDVPALTCAWGHRGRLVGPDDHLLTRARQGRVGLGCPIWSGWWTAPAPSRSSRLLRRNAHVATMDVAWLGRVPVPFHGYGGRELGCVGFGLVATTCTDRDCPARVRRWIPLACTHGCTRFARHGRTDAWPGHLFSGQKIPGDCSCEL